MKKTWFFAGVLGALTFGSFANLPLSGDTAGSVAAPSDVSEIRAKRQADLAFDSDFRRLADAQSHYRENLTVRRASARPVRPPASSQPRRTSGSRAASRSSPAPRPVSTRGRLPAPPPMIVPAPAAL